ncbi:FAD-dependent oxidoreductase [Actinoplanes palleronii]|uniref:FAD-binding monooxygenase n=1 Tax=Actinoplanes palleronii TaxID=113570 RepID=A0ABQ4B617_9ACTN|nr:FAD-dependent monooxygenase [Actinoplanes palleronii]GIE65891.1 FAD-binding monooxygenase [Actinoplanes palleronii]
MPATTVTTFARIASDLPPRGPALRLDTAIVLGGSVAGMLAARVLADHADTVLIVERDGGPAASGTRAGVPHGNQVHVLLAAFTRQIERWFPGFTGRAVAGGAVRITAESSRSYANGVPKVSIGDRAVLSMTRPYLEQRIRAELAAVPNVRMVTGRVTGLEFDRSAVTAVRYEADGAGVRQPAGLVVDALGRGSRVTDWLTAAGWHRPPMLRGGDAVNYATAVFQRPPEQDSVRRAAALDPATGEGAIFQSVEGDRYLVMQGGIGDSRPGGTAEDMVSRLRHLLPEPFGRVAENELIGEVVTYRLVDSRRRDFWACTQFPARLIPVGDAVASLNPFYGQGLSSAALHASALSLYLRSAPDLDFPARDYLAMQKVVVDAAWAISTRSPETGDARRWIVRQIVRAAVVDCFVATAFADVTQMLKHPATLFTPAVVARALLARLRRLPAPVRPIAGRVEVLSS